MAKVFESKIGTVLRYENLGEYFKQLDEPRVSGRDDSSDEYSSGGSWQGTSTYEEAENLMMSGDEESHKKLVELKSKTDKYYIEESGTKIKTYNDVVGYTPNVPNAVMGLPNSMINSQREPKKHKVLDLFVNRSRSAMTSTDQIQYEGALILSFLDALERDGFRVNLFVGKISWHGGRSEVQGHIVPIKLATDPLNIKKVAYYLVNPAFLRRTAFRIDETETRMPDVTNYGYGQTTNRGTLRDFLSNEINEQMIIVDDSLDLDMHEDDKDNIDKLNKLFNKL